MGQTAIINGINYSWADITLILLGNPVFGITKIKYNKKQKKENNYGAGTKAISRGYGNEEPEASITIYQDEWRNIKKGAPGKNPLKIPPFNIPVLFGQVNGLDIDKDILQACEFTSDGLEAGQGDSKLLIEVPLIVGDIYTP